MPNRREEIIVGVAEDPDNWRLRLATLDDIDGLHSLASIPLVYRYLFDGAATGEGIHRRPGRPELNQRRRHWRRDVAVGKLVRTICWLRLTDRLGSPTHYKPVQPQYSGGLTITLIGSTHPGTWRGAGQRAGRRALDQP